MTPRRLACGVELTGVLAIRTPSVAAPAPPRKCPAGAPPARAAADVRQAPDRPRAGLGRRPLRLGHASSASPMTIRRNALYGQVADRRSRLVRVVSPAQRVEGRIWSSGWSGLQPREDRTSPPASGQQGSSASGTASIRFGGAARLPAPRRRSRPSGLPFRSAFGRPLRCSHLVDRLRAGEHHLRGVPFGVPRSNSSRARTHASLANVFGSSVSADASSARRPPCSSWAESRAPIAAAVSRSPRTNGSAVSRAARSCAAALAAYPPRSVCAQRGGLHLVGRIVVETARGRGGDAMYGPVGVRR